MKKLIAIFFGIMISVSLLMGSQARVSALGNEPAMLINDDVSIDLFPQRINDFSLARVEGLGNIQPGYLLLIGDTGDKWGVWGSSTTTENMFNIYRSMSDQSALKLSFLIGRDHTYQKNSSQKNKRTKRNLESTLTYGWDNINSEKALTVSLDYGPGSDLYDNDNYSSFDYTNYGAIDTTTTSGSAYQLNFTTSFSNRCNQGLLFFNHRYDRVGLSFGFGGHEVSTGSQKNSEGSLSNFSLNARTFTFNTQNLNEQAQLYYGVGTGLGYMSSTNKDEITDNKSSNHTFYFGRMNIAAGIETYISNFDFRVGINRTNTLFRSSGSKLENGTTTEDSESHIGSSSGYGIATGLGYNYKDLQINVLLNNNIFNSGPQMIFDSNAGNIFASFDVVYSL